VARLDDRLRHDLERAGRPADPGGVYETLIRRRERRRIARRVQSVALTVVVAVGSLGGIWALSWVFGVGDHREATAPGSANGSIAVTWARGFPNPELDLALVSTDDGSVTRLTTGTELDSEPAWSPDGSTIAFWRAPRDGSSRPGLYTIGPDGGEPSLLLESDLSIGAISWSPDGDRIVFVGATPADGTELDMPAAVYTIAANGSDLQELPIDGHVREVAWSPDGTSLAVMKLYPAGGDRSGQDIYVVDLATGEERRLTNDGRAWKPAWSPDGTRIAFASSETGEIGDGDLYVVDADGSGRARLTASPGLEEGVSWAPDGSAIAVVRYRTTGRSDCDIVLVAPDGSSERMLLDGPVDGACPIEVAWQPVPRTEGPPSPSETPASTGPTGPTSTDTPMEVAGIGPVCDLSSVRGDFGGRGDLGTAYVYAEPDEAGGCLPDGAGLHRLGIDLGAGRVKLTSDPLECGLAGCSAFAAPDIDGDHRSEIAILTPSSGVPWDFVSLYRVAGDQPGADGAPAIAQIAVEEPAAQRLGVEPGPLTIPWGSSQSDVYGAECWSATDGADPDVPVLVLVHATPDGAGGWDQRYVELAIEGSTARVFDVFRTGGEGTDLSTRYADTFCGSPILP
jgi:hypothetical protein